MSSARCPAARRKPASQEPSMDRKTSIFSEIILGILTVVGGLLLFVPLLLI